MKSARLWDRVTGSKDKFTPSEVLIAEALRTQAFEIPFSSALRMSAALGVSEATLIRFARRIGFNSYAELQKELREEIRQRLNQTTLERLHEQKSGDSELHEIFLGSLQQDAINLELTRSSVQGPMVESAIEFLSNARRLYVAGSRASAASALFAANMLRYLVDDVRWSMTPDSFLDELIGIDSSDALLTIALARPARRTLEMVMYAKEKGAKIVAITDNPLSPIADLADSFFIVESDSTAFMQSYTAVTAMISALISGLGAVCSETTELRLAEAERLMERFSLNVKS